MQSNVVCLIYFCENANFCENSKEKNPTHHLQKKLFSLLGLVFQSSFKPVLIILEMFACIYSEEGNEWWWWFSQ